MSRFSTKLFDAQPLPGKKKPMTTWDLSNPVPDMMAPKSQSKLPAPMKAEQKDMDSRFKMLVDKESRRLVAVVDTEKLKEFRAHEEEWGGPNRAADLGGLEAGVELALSKLRWFIEHPTDSEALDVIVEVANDLETALAQSQQAPGGKPKDYMRGE
jgi:hypothetical protein